MAELRCVGCGSAEHLIVDDGAPVCRVCVMRWGAAAAFPDRLPVTIRSELAACHRDVVTYENPRRIMGLGYVRGGMIAQIRALPGAWRWRDGSR